MGSAQSRRRLEGLSSSSSTSSTWSRWRDWKESLYLAAAGMGEGPRMGPPGASHREAAPHPGPGGNRGQWRHLSSVLIVMGKEMTPSTFCPVLPFNAEAKGATQRAG